MKFNGPNSEVFITGREIGKGGEGTVYELQSHADQVLKLYNEPLSEVKTEKLKLMIELSTPDLLAYAAWPILLVFNNHNQACGFAMRKLTGWVPLHKVFGPLDRKKIFPDRGYNFLVHVARNIAIAFHKLHSAGIVAGDINEGNILISRTGLAAFIDCDSFQVPDGGNHFFCEVGVPRYTPPELLRKKTFEKVVRTANTDNFSLAVLIFQLLFMGRHPFAGRSKTRSDIDEETAIRQKQFAYSLIKTNKKLLPPADSLPMESLPNDIIDLFHRAFEQDDRPTATEWVSGLDKLLSGMTTCQAFQTHSYPKQMPECPWCRFRKERGIMYFLDDTFFQANNALSNIEEFINNYQPEKLTIKTPDQITVTLPITPAQPDSKVVRYTKFRKQVPLVLFLSGLGVAIISPYVTLLCLLLASYLYKFSGWARHIQTRRLELSRKIENTKENLRKLKKAYEHHISGTTYEQKQDILLKLIREFNQLPEEVEKRKHKLEQSLYNEQLDNYLRQFDIEKETIPSIGTVKKGALYRSGIYTAAHLSKLTTVKVPGIGPGLQQVLFDWRQHLSASFVYVREDYRINIGMQQVYKEIEQHRLQLKAGIRREYQQLNFLRIDLTNKATALESQIRTVKMQLSQAEADLEEFNKVAA